MKLRSLVCAALAAAVVPGVNAQEKFTYMTNWYAQAEHGANE